MVPAVMAEEKLNVPALNPFGRLLMMARISATVCWRDSRESGDNMQTTAAVRPSAPCV